VFGFMKRWRPTTLLAWWVGYWLALAVFGLWPAWAAIWRATHASGGKSDVSFNVGDNGCSLTVHLNGHTTYAGTVSFLSLALFVAVPPLLLWVLWLAQRPRDTRIEERV
jgi:hypothetical protein